MKYETIDAAQIDDLMERREVRPPRDAHDRKDDDKPSAGATATGDKDAKVEKTTDADKKPENKLDDTDQPSVN